MSILESPMWQGVSGLLALVAIAVSVVIYRLQTRRRSFAYHIVTDTPLISEPKLLKGKVKILVSDTQVGTLRLLIVRFQNTGGAALQKAEFDGPIRLKFSEPGAILLAAAADPEPKNLPLVVETTDTAVEVAPLLLNSKDAFAIHCVLGSATAKLSVDARIAGVKALTQVVRDPDLPSLVSDILPHIQTAVVGAALLATLTTGLFSSEGVQRIVRVLIQVVSRTLSAV